ncbi:hypothetical protein BD324DRAFT_615390 [Kockovaella imperatae]|uniref:Zinc finger C2H2 LYAR-type domain-containing protein n=1 Tax=Kockovaella imperatae TaxID=4999 RepID=A0A1Y1UPD5_9TREE|nr:hypothetical protein BD324DRAFT_615390 [Kockovaella imperatae]ORX39891.1 hypothetical protein BD324DRAFT_615390 [Kockovaella imperatae]
MVSFQCDGCADTVKKPKLDQHRQRCWASFTCLDCSQTFNNQDYKKHTSCISEAEKYQGALYRGPKKGGAQANGERPVKSKAPQEPVKESMASTCASPLPSQSSIHPDRLSQFDAGPAHDFSNAGPSRGRGGFRGRGGPQARGRGGYHGHSLVSGENKLGPKDGMRTWGSPAVTPKETTPEPSASTAREKRPRDTTSTPVEKKKKTKRDESPSSARTAQQDNNDPKLIKRLRKKAAKLGEKGGKMNLDEFTRKLMEGKQETMDLTQLLQHASVHNDGTRWVLEI